VSLTVSRAMLPMFDMCHYSEFVWQEFLAR